jgi:uncharacterized protein (DUF342 family)
MTDTPERELIERDFRSAIWGAGKRAKPIEGYPVSKEERAAFNYGKDCATADIEVAVGKLASTRIEALLSRVDKLEERVRELEAKLEQKKLKIVHADPIVFEDDTLNRSAS